MVILTAAVIFFLGPLVAAFKYSLIQQNGKYGFNNYSQILSNGDLRRSLFTSLEIAGLDRDHRRRR